MHTGNRCLAVVAGNGLVADAALSAGADMLLVLNAGAYQTAGLGSLASFMPYANANQQMLELLQQHILPRRHQQTRHSIIAGVLAHDPLHPLPELLMQLKELGVSGICNWPAVGFIDGNFRQALDTEGRGIHDEITLFQTAQEYGLQRCAFVCNTSDARQLAACKPEIIIANLGLTKTNTAMERRDRVSQAAQQLQDIKHALNESQWHGQLLAFGGPIIDAHDLQALQQQVHIDGYAGGSIFERLPVNDIIRHTVKRFRSALNNSNRTETHNSSHLIRGQSRQIQDVHHMIKRVAPFDVHVCIEGESGTGKELIAAAIQNHSTRAHQAFVTVNCGAIAEHLLESELFGHVAGAFTGAASDRAGKFALAHRGTLFLDEIADLSAHGQVALLRAIQQREITPVGSDQSQANDVRIICASNQSLEKLVADGRFRADLYYRLSAFTISVPALRQRIDDLDDIISFFLQQLSTEVDREIVGIHETFRKRLRQHAWPGNVRELQHVLRRAAILEDGPLLAGESFNPQARTSTSDQRKQRALSALDQHNGNKLAAAKDLGISRKTLYQWLKL